MASDVHFTTNPNEFTQLESLYVSERNPPGFIRGRDLSVTGMFGLTVRGPTTPQTITSVSRFLEVYGGRDRGTGPGLALVNEIWKALINKPFGALVVRRVVAVGAAPAVAASVTLDDAVDGTGTDIVRIDASSVGAWGNDIDFKVEAASDADANHWNLVIRYLDREFIYENLDTQANTDNLAEVIGDDLGNAVVVTKLADGRPVNSSTITEATYVAARDANDYVSLGDTTLAAAFSSVAGSEGTMEAADYTAALIDMATVDGPSVVLAPESLEDTVAASAQATLNGAIVTQAAAVSDRMFLTWSGTVGQTPAQEVADITADITTRSDRIVWMYNAPKSLDPDTAVKIDTAPHVWLASILSQNDVDIHPGSFDASRQLAGIAELNNQSLTRADLISLKNAGISTIEKLEGRFQIRSGVTTSLESGKEEITRRRMADFLQLSAADRLKTFVKAKSTIEKRAQIAGELTAFSRSLQDQSRIIESFEIQQAEVNTPAQRAQGIEKILWRVRLINHILFLVLETEIGTGVTVTEAA